MTKKTQRVMNYVNASAYLDMDTPRFLKHVRSGQIPARMPEGVKIPERGRIPLNVLFRIEDLDRFIDEMPIYKP